MQCLPYLSPTKKIDCIFKLLEQKENVVTVGKVYEAELQISRKMKSEAHLLEGVICAGF